MKAVLVNPYEVGWEGVEYGPFEIGIDIPDIKENDLIKLDDRYYLVFDSYVDGSEMVISVKPIELKARFYSEDIEDIYTFKICKEEEE